MEPWTTIISSLIATIFTGLISGIFIHKIQQKMDKRQKKLEDEEQKRVEALNKYNMLILQGLIASLSLGEATAEAVEIGKYNGKQKDARKYAEDVKHDIQNFMYKQGTEHLK